MGRTRAWKWCAGAVVIAMFVGSAASAFDEISKTGMTATGTASPWGWDPPGAIDGLLTGGKGWITDVAPAYVQINLGARYLVQQFGQQPRVGNHECWTKDYEIYVTDDEGDWGDPVAVGTFPDSPDRQDVVFATPKNGSFLVFRCLNGYYGANKVGTHEVYIYGGPPSDYVSAFALADQTSGSTLFTTDDAVDVTLEGDGGTGPYLFVIDDVNTTPAADDGRWDSAPASINLSDFFGGLIDGTNYTLYAWTKDAASQISAARSVQTLYNSLTPAVSNLAVNDGTSPDVTVSWRTDLKTYGRLLYRRVANPANDWIATSWDESGRTNHSAVMVNCAPGAAYEYQIGNNETAEAVASHVKANGEIPRAQIYPYANSEAYGSSYNAWKAIDGVPSSAWVTNVKPSFLRLDLGERFLLTKFTYQGRQSNQSHIKDYEIYVTDTDSDIREDWGTPVAAGTWPDDQDPHDVVFAAPKNGQFAILYAATGYGGEVSASEVWVYGGAPMTFLSVFSLVDQSTRHSYITDSPIVDATLEGDGGVAPYEFIIDSDNSVKPDAADPRWAAAPASIDLTTFFGGLVEDETYTLYAWTKDANDLVSNALAHTMVYKTLVAMFEIPKSVMTATTNNVRSNDPNFVASKAIDGSVSTIGWLAEITNGWLKLDLGDRYLVQRLDYNGRPSDYQGRIQDYEIYVTDVDSFSKDDWGTPVAAGTFLNENSRQTVTFTSPRNGRYVILYSVSGYASGQSGASEVWLYGQGAASYVDQFTLADASTGSPQITNAYVVDVAALSAQGGIEPYVYIIGTDSEDNPLGGDGRWAAAPATLDISTLYAEPGDGLVYTFHAWAKDATGATTPPKALSILYNSDTPLTSDVSVTDAGIAATVTWTTDSLAFGRVLYRKVGAADWTAAAWEAAYGYSHSVVMTDLCPGRTYEFIIQNNESSDAARTHTRGYGEIPKSMMTATTNNVRSDDPNFAASKAINDVLDTGWLAEITNGWLKLDLGDRYQVQQFDYNPRPYNESRIRDYEIYVTDVDSTTKDDWGTPVAVGTFLDENSRQAVAFGSPKNGRYVILYAVSSYSPGQSGASEVWVFGDAVTNYVQEFVLTDKTSGSNLYTNADSVNVTLAGGGGTEPYQFIIGADAGTKPAASDPGWGNPASLSLSAFFDPLTDGADYTLFAWTKDADGTISAARGFTILYNSLTPAVSNVNITQDVDPTATVTWDTDSESYGRIRYKEFGTGTWVVEPYEASHGLSHSVTMSNICPGKTYTYVIENNEAADVERSYVRGRGEIPKVRMTATGKPSPWGWDPEGAIDGLLENGKGWLTDGVPADLVIDLGENFLVDQIDYQPRLRDRGGRTADYQFFVSETTEELGEPVLQGTFPDDDLLQVLSLTTPKSGRYVTFRCLSGYVGQQVGTHELWVYGDGVPQVAIEITEFSVSDQTTGSTLFTNTRDVNVALSVETIGEATVDGYLISESGTPPEEGWSTTAPDSYSITGPEGSVTVYAWVLSGTTTTSATATILFSTAAPAASNIVVTDNGDGTATATWSTDILALGSVNYGPVEMAGTTPSTVSEPAIGTDHSVTFGITAGTNYKVVLVNNEVASPAFWWPDRWPVTGDANRDCRVNILDLIFIRNRLNQEPGTGDNWQADVNCDTRINILDLIYVRNRLNMQCP